MKIKLLILLLVLASSALADTVRTVDRSPITLSRCVLTE